MALESLTGFNLTNSGTKISALTAVVTPADTDAFAIVSGGATKQMTLNQLDAYIESRGRVHNASVANQGAGFAADTYLTGSYITIPAGRLQAKTKYYCRFVASKTAAGVATPIITVRTGTAGTTADTSRAAMTFTAQTAVIDSAVIEVWATFRTVGSGTSAVIRADGMIDHTLAATGFSTSNIAIAGATSSGFDSTTASLGIGISVNGGTSAAWTVTQVQAMLENLG